MIAEEAHARFRRVLGHRMQEVIPIFLYASNQDFSATNILPFSPGESTGGFTDFFRRRVVVPFNGDYESLRHVLSHEIAHAFQFDVFIGPRYDLYPLWLMEGLCEYLTLGWDASAEVFVRDLALHGKLPSIADLEAGRVRSGYAFYKMGQAVFVFIEERFGRERVEFFVKEIAALRDPRTAYHSAFDMTPEEFDLAFVDYWYDRYAPARAALQQNDARMRPVSLRFDPDGPLSDRIGFHLHPALSPDGKSIAYISATGIFPSIVVRPAPGPDVSPDQLDETVIVVKALRSKRYEEYQPLTTRLSWSPDGRFLLVAGRFAGEQALLIVDVREESVIRALRPPFDAMQYPVFGPDGQSVVFTGVTRGRSDLFVLTLSDGTLRRLTDDDAYESDARLSNDGRFVFFSVGRDAPGRRDLVRLRLRADDGSWLNANERYLSRNLLTDLPGRAEAPLPAEGDSLIFTSDHSGVRNLYRLENASVRSVAVVAEDVQPLTQSATGVVHASLVMAGRCEIVTQEDDAADSVAVPEECEGLAFTERRDGALELVYLPAGLGADGRRSENPRRISAATPLDPETRTFDPALYRSPLANVVLDEAPEYLDFGREYRPALSFEGFPFVLVGGGSDADGETRIAGIAAAQFADDAGDHRLFTLLGYGEAPPEWSLDLRYSYLKLRPDFFAGVYRQSGAFPVQTFYDLSLNNILYNPYFRVLDQDVYGVYGGVEYPLHKFGSLTLAFEQGREERIFRRRLPEEREQEDVFVNHYQVSLSYRFDNTVYGRYGALDGHGIFFSYGVPLRPLGIEREVYALAAEYRLHHWFENGWTFHWRLFGGSVTGGDATDYPFRIGGYATIRGYDFQEFEGRHAFFSNVELRVPFVKYILFGFPAEWSPGGIQGVLFVDAGSAFDDSDTYQAYDSDANSTRDLYASYGVGIHWQNFMWFVIPGAVMKIEWATPYDFKTSDPPRKWKGVFSVGFNF